VYDVFSAGATVMAIDNPIDGIVPNFGIFGAEFTAWWQKLFAAAWALGLLVAIFFLLQGVVTMANAGDNPHDYAQGRGRAIKALIGLVLVAAFAVLVGAVLSVAS